MAVVAHIEAQVSWNLTLLVFSDTLHRSAESSGLFPTCLSNTSPISSLINFSCQFQVNPSTTNPNAAFTFCYAQILKLSAHT